MQFRNPIIPGYNPDPSITRVGDTFYLVNSSFEFFPGVPIRESKNLVNWTFTGYVLDRESQLPLHGSRPSGGIFAPTIRYHDGMFYMITTNVNLMPTGHPNFIVHAEDPAGPWSEPAWISQVGIDPSIFFDDDGSCWYTGTGDDGTGRQGIVCFKLDPMTGEILSDKKIISHGSGGKCPEGPHLYKKDGWYYLMLAEGGTEFGHMETIGRSRTIDGPYEFCPNGPILTARDDNGNGSPIQCTGHADIVDDANGNWWIVSLGTRPIGPMAHHLGRETFLAQLDWVDGWPVVRNGGLMQLEAEGDLPQADTVKPVSDDLHCDFANMDKLPPEFNYLRNPVAENYKLDGALTLTGTAERLSAPNTTPTFTGIRQTQFISCTTAVLGADIPEGCSAGITAYGIHTHHYDVLVTRRYGKLYAQLRKHLYDMEMVAAEIPLPECESVSLRITSNRTDYTFSVDYGQGYIVLGHGMTIGLATEVTETMTFTGAYLAMFAENGAVRFKSFDYEAEWEPAPKRGRP